MWEPRRLRTIWASTVCYRDSLTFLLYIAEFASRDLKRRRDDAVSIADAGILSVSVILIMPFEAIETLTAAIINRR
jgi:hypothetical protein